MSRAARETAAWFDIGTPESYLDAVDWFPDGECYVHPDAELTDTELGDSVQILDGARLEDVAVENSVIFPDATVSGGEIRRTSIDQNTGVASRWCESASASITPRRGSIGRRRAAR